MERRVISFLLALVLLFGLVAVGTPTVSAASDKKASESIIDLIKHFEGFLPKAREDYGQYTIGYGTACDPEDYPNGITREEADKLLREALVKFEKSVNTFIDKNGLKLTQNQFDALVSFTYNLGTNWMNNDSTFRRAVINGAKGNDFLFAITQWCTAGSSGQKQILQNLVDRRLIEANVYLNGNYSTSVLSNYDYVTFENNIADPSNTIRIQGYDSKLTDSVRAKPTKSGYRFLGWYTAAEGGEWIDVLNASTAGKKLYGHWQKGTGTAAGTAASYKRVTNGETTVYDKFNGTKVKTVAKGTTVTVTADYMDIEGVKWGKIDGGWIKLTATKAAGSASSGNQNTGSDTAGATKVTVTADSVNIRKGPGTNYEKAGKATRGQVLAITKVQQGSNHLWGQFSGGWVALEYTDYDKVIAESSPDADEITATGVVVKTDKLNIRNKPGTSGTTVVGQYYRGDIITITLQQEVAGTIWGKTPRGWVSLYYVDVTPADSTGGSTEKPDDSGSEDSGSAEKPADKVVATGVVVDCTRLRVRKGPGTNYAEVGYIAAGTPVEIYEQVSHGSQIWGRTAKGWICMDYVELDVEISDSENAVTGTVYNCSQLNVRKGPGTNYSKVAKIPSGTRVEIYETTMVKDVKWGRTSLGWVSMAYIKLDGDETEKPETEKPETEKPETEKPETEKPETEKPETEKPETETPSTKPMNKTGVIVKTDELRIRAGAGTQYDQVGTLRKGERVVILETAQVGKATWGRIEKGWIHMYYVELDGQEVPSGTVSRTVTTNGLNIRAGAGTNYDKVGTYNKGDVVMIYEQTTVKDRPWGRTDKGWICLEYVK